MRTFAAFLHGRYVDWCATCGERRTLGQWAAHLGIHYATINQWMNGHALPRPEFADRLAQKLGMEVYDALGKPRPDSVLYSLMTAWPTLPTAAKSVIEEILSAAKQRPTQ